MRRTRELLSNAVRHLLRQQDPETISVRDIAAVAGTSRPTFYQHYSSPDELIADTVRRDLHALLETATPPARDDEGLPPAMLALFTELNQLRWFYRRLVAQITPVGRSRQEIVSHLADRFEDLIHVRAPTLSQDQRTEAARFLAGGTLGLLSAWLVSPDPATSAEVSAFAERAWRLILTVLDGLG